MIKSIVCNKKSANSKFEFKTYDKCFAWHNFSANLIGTDGFSNILQHMKFFR